MANLLLIRYICKAKKITIRELSNKVGIGEAALQALIKSGSTNTKTLEKIAKELDVNAGIFFDDSINIGHTTGGYNSHISGNIKVGIAEGVEKEKIKVEYLERIIKDKDEIIELLKNKI